MKLSWRMVGTSVVSLLVLAACDKFEKGPPEPLKDAKGNIIKPSPTTTPPTPSPAKSSESQDTEPKSSETVAFTATPRKLIDSTLQHSMAGKNIRLSAGGGHTCIANSQDKDSVLNTIYCWGRNTFQQLGMDFDSPYSIYPYSISFRGIQGKKISSISAGQDHTCALIGDKHEVVCWGNNERMQLAPAGAVTDANMISARGDRTCATTGPENKQAICWGKAAGQQPQPPTPLNYINGKPIKALATVGDGECVVIDDKLTCHSSKLEKVSGSLEDLVQLSAGWRHVCGLIGRDKADLRLKCYGDFEDSNADKIPPTAGEVVAIKNIAQLSSGNDHICAINTKGRIFCWGNNDHGKAGVAATEKTPMPTKVEHPTEVVLPSASPAIAITAGDSHTCAILKNKSVWCWGDNTQGQLGIDPPDENKNF